MPGIEHGASTLSKNTTDYRTFRTTAHIRCAYYQSGLEKSAGRINYSRATGVRTTRPLKRPLLITKESQISAANANESLTGG